MLVMSRQRNGEVTKLTMGKRLMHMHSRLSILSYKWTNCLQLWTHANQALYIAIKPKMLKILGIAWNSKLEEVSKQLIHLCHLVEDEIIKGEDVVEASGEFVEKIAKEPEVPQKFIPIPRPPPPFPQK